MWRWRTRNSLFSYIHTLMMDTKKKGTGRAAFGIPGYDLGIGYIFSRFYFHDTHAYKLWLTAWDMIWIILFIADGTSWILINSHCLFRFDATKTFHFKMNPTLFRSISNGNKSNLFYRVTAKWSSVKTETHLWLIKLQLIMEWILTHLKHRSRREHPPPLFEQKIKYT